MNIPSLGYMQIYHLIVFIVVLTLHISIYMWIDKLEKENCECSKLWHRDILKALAIVLFVLTCINMFLLTKNNSNSKVFIENVSKHMLGKVYLGFSLLFGFSYIFIMFDYIRRLKEMECECSEDWKREFGWWYSILVMSIYGLLLVMLSIIVVSGAYLMFSKK